MTVEERGIGILEEFAEREAPVSLDALYSLCRWSSVNDPAEKYLRRKATEGEAFMAEKRARTRRLATARATAGLCVSCGAISRPERRRCQACADKVVAFKRRWRARRAA